MDEVLFFGEDDFDILDIDGYWTAPQKLDRKNLTFGVFLLWN